MPSVLVIFPLGPYTIVASSVSRGIVQEEHHLLWLLSLSSVRTWTALSGVQVVDSLLTEPHCHLWALSVSTHSRRTHGPGTGDSWWFRLIWRQSLNFLIGVIAWVLSAQVGCWTQLCVSLLVAAKGLHKWISKSKNQMNCFHLLVLDEDSDDFKKHITWMSLN